MLDKIWKVVRIILATSLFVGIWFGVFMVYNDSVLSGSHATSAPLSDQVGWLIGMVTIFLTAFGMVSVLFFAVIVAMVWDSVKAHQESREITREMNIMKEDARKFVEEDVPKITAQLQEYSKAARGYLVEQISVKNRAERLSKKRPV